MFRITPEEATALLAVSPVAQSLYLVIRVFLATNPSAISWPMLAAHYQFSIAKIRRLADQLQHSNLIKIISTKNKLVIELTTETGRQIDRQTGRQDTHLEQPVPTVSSDALEKTGRQTDRQTGSPHLALYKVPTGERTENINILSPLEDLEVNNNYSGSNISCTHTITTTTAREELSDDYSPNWQRWEEFLSREYQIQLHQLKHPATIQMLHDWASKGVTIGDAKTGIAHAKAVLAARGQTLPAYPSYYRRFVTDAQHTRLQEKERPAHENYQPAFNPRRKTVSEKWNEFLYGTPAGTVYDATFVAS